MDALFRFIVQLLPIGKELGIVTFGSEFGFGWNVNIESTMIQKSNKQGLHGRKPYRLLENDLQGCSECGLEAALDLLNVPRQKTNYYNQRLNEPHYQDIYSSNLENTDGEIILISARPFPPKIRDSKKKLLDVSRRIKENGIPLIHIFFELGAAAEEKEWETAHFGNMSYDHMSNYLSNNVTINNHHEEEPSKMTEQDFNPSEFGGVFRVPVSTMPSYLSEELRIK